MRWRRSPRRWSARACRSSATCPISPSCRSPRAAAPITACSCSCSCCVSATFAAAAIHRLASDRLRRGPAWDCGYPDPSPATQYTASSFAQPIRRVFGTLVFRARERVEMPPPGDMRPARLEVELQRSHLGRALRADRRWRRLCRRASEPPAVPHHPPLSQPRLRRPCRSCSWCSPYGPDARSRRPGRADAAGAAARAAAHRLRAQGEGAAVAPPGSAADPALPRPRAADAQGGGAGGQRVLAVPRRSPTSSSPPPGSRHRWCRPSRTGLMFSWSADLIAIIALLGLRALLPRAGRPRRRHELRRHRLEPRGDDRLARRAGHADDRVHARARRRLDPALDHGRHTWSRPRSACASRSAWR